MPASVALDFQKVLAQLGPGAYLQYQGLAVWQVGQGDGWACGATPENASRNYVLLRARLDTEEMQTYVWGAR